MLSQLSIKGRNSVNNLEKLWRICLFISWFPTRVRKWPNTGSPISLDSQEVCKQSDELVYYHKVCLGMFWGQNVNESERYCMGNIYVMILEVTLILSFYSYFESWVSFIVFRPAKIWRDTIQNGGYPNFITVG